MVDRDPQNGCCQCQSSGGSQLPHASPGGFSKNNKWFWPRHLSHYCICPASCHLEHVRFCACPFRLECLFPIAFHLSWVCTLLVFKDRHYGGSSSQCRSPRMGSPIWGSDLLLLGEDLYSCVISLAFGSST